MASNKTPTFKESLFETIWWATEAYEYRNDTE